jgi:hypothetical protein
VAPNERIGKLLLAPTNAAMLTVDEGRDVRTAALGELLDFSARPLFGVAGIPWSARDPVTIRIELADAAAAALHCVRRALALLRRRRGSFVKGDLDPAETLTEILLEGIDEATVLIGQVFSERR